MTNILENIIADKKNSLELIKKEKSLDTLETVSYTHLRAHET